MNARAARVKPVREVVPVPGSGHLDQLVRGEHPAVRPPVSRREALVEAAALRRVRARAEVPLADARGGIPGPGQRLCDDRRVQRKAQGQVGLQEPGVRQDVARKVLRQSGPGRPHPGEDAGSRRGAVRSRGVGVGEPDAVPGKPVDVRGSMVGVPVGADVGVAHVVQEQEQDVGPIGRRSGHNRGEKRGHQGGMHAERRRHCANVAAAGAVRPRRGRAGRGAPAPSFATGRSLSNGPFGPQVTDPHPALTSDQPGVPARRPQLASDIATPCRRTASQRPRDRMRHAGDPGLSRARVSPRRRHASRDSMRIAPRGTSARASPIHGTLPTAGMPPSGTDPLSQTCASDVPAGPARLPDPPVSLRVRCRSSSPGQPRLSARFPCEETKSTFGM